VSIAYFPHLQNSRFTQQKKKSSKLYLYCPFQYQFSVQYHGGKSMILNSALCLRRSLNYEKTHSNIQTVQKKKHYKKSLIIGQRAIKLTLH